MRRIHSCFFLGIKRIYLVFFHFKSTVTNERIKQKDQRRSYQQGEGAGVGASFNWSRGRSEEILSSCHDDLYGRAVLLMHSCWEWRRRKIFFWTGKFGHVDLLFRRNSLIAPYEFTMEKLLFVVRSLKGRLVNNLENLLLHGNEDLRKLILDWEEKRDKSQGAYDTKGKGNMNISYSLFFILYNKGLK